MQTQDLLHLYAMRRDRAVESGDWNIAALCGQIVENLQLCDADGLSVEAKELAQGVENLIWCADSKVVVAGWCFPLWVSTQIE
jgi:hypothetical protein